jgi:hypothetical protein
VNPAGRRSSGGLRLAAFVCAFAAAGAWGCRRGPSRLTVEPAPDEDPHASGAASPGGAAGKPILDPFSLTRAESRSIDLFLSKNPSLRLARDSDAKGSDDADDVAKLYGVYHPYFVRGDVNDDGSLDFAAAFVDRQKPGPDLWFTVVVFCSDRAGGFRAPETLEREISLERGDLSIDRDCVIVTPDLGEDSNRRYRWNSLRRQFEFVSDDDETAEPRPINRI